MRVMDMGLFDGVMGKKGKDDGIVLEKRNEGYVLNDSKARAPDVKMACAFINSAEPPEDEAGLVKSLVKEFGLAEKLFPDTPIVTSYGAMPDIDEYLNTREMPDSLNAFIMARAMLNGLARGPAEMGKLAVNPFNVRGIKGVLVLKEA